jgi:hypothetical protein
LLELADLDQIEAEGLDVGQYPVERGPVQEPPSTVCAPCRRAAIAGNADSTVAPR